MASDIVRARVDPELARRVESWAEAHDTDVSETIRIALRRLLDDEERWKRAQERARLFAEMHKSGLFEPPKKGETWKAGGFR